MSRSFILKEEVYAQSLLDDRLFETLLRRSLFLVDFAFNEFYFLGKWVAVRPINAYLLPQFFVLALLKKPDNITQP